MAYAATGDQENHRADLKKVLDSTNDAKLRQRVTSLLQELVAESAIFSKVTGKWTWSDAKSPCVEVFHTIRFLKNNSVAEFTNSGPFPDDEKIVPYTYTILGHADDRILMLHDAETQKTADGKLVEWELILYSADVYYWRRTDWDDLVTKPIVRCTTDAVE